VATLQKVQRGKYFIFLNVATAKPNLSGFINVMRLPLLDRSKCASNAVLRKFCSGRCIPWVGDLSRVAGQKKLRKVWRAVLIFHQQFRSLCFC